MSGSARAVAWNPPTAWVAILLLALALSGARPAGAQDAADARARAWLATHRESPEDYVVRQFDHARIVLLGEDHGVREHVLFVQRLIPRLQRAGVTTLGLEFGAAEDQPALDALVSAVDYDEAAARRILFGYDTAWAYVEYLDLYRAAWAFNRSRPRGTPPFRILNLSYRYDWRAAGAVMTPVRARAIFAQGPVDRFRADRIKAEILDPQRKLLALVGTVHATTRYAQREYDYNAPDFEREDRRHLGNLLLAMAPGRVRSILFHQPFASAADGGAKLQQPANGAIERLMHATGDVPAGFDLDSTPLGALPDRSYYGSGEPGFTLGRIADGYVYLAPLARLTGCTVDEQFVTAANWREAQARFASQMRARPASLDDYWRSVREYADLRARYADVQ